MIWPYLTVEQLAEIAQLSEKTVRRAITRGELHAFRCGTRVRIREDEARAWIEAEPARAQPRSVPGPPRLSAGHRRTEQGSYLDLMEIDRKVAG
ncbi:MAG TPA: helix-turn-helix domain-containing protein [Solirubrobacteraceae bacterium]